MLSKLSDLQKTSGSLEVLHKVNGNIPERKFHDFTYILHDIRTLLGKEEKTYLEIGSYVGSSASLMLQHIFKTNVLCIDPCVLNMGHYKGSVGQYETLNKNLLINNIHNYKIDIYTKFSNDSKLLQQLRDSNTKVDILFIDGDHTRQGVINDWDNFHQFVNQGGFICFDDYYDDTYSPEVRPAVDSIVQNIDKTIYEVIGSLDNIHKLCCDDLSYKHPNHINEFIIHKKII